MNPWYQEGFQVQDFAFGIDCEGRGSDILGNMIKNCMKTTNSAFSGKNIKGAEDDNPIFVVLQGFPHSPHKASAWTFFFPSQFLGVPRTHMINFRRMKG